MLLIGVKAVANLEGFQEGFNCKGWSVRLHLIKVAILRDKKRRKKPSTRQEWNPQPEEFSSAGMCSISVQQPRCPGFQAGWKKCSGDRVDSNPDLLIMWFNATPMMPWAREKNSQRKLLEDVSSWREKNWINESENIGLCWVQYH